MFAVTQSDDAKALERQSLNLWRAKAKNLLSGCPARSAAEVRVLTERLPSSQRRRARSAAQDAISSSELRTRRPMLLELKHVT